MPEPLLVPSLFLLFFSLVFLSLFLRSFPFFPFLLDVLQIAAFRLRRAHNFRNAVPLSWSVPKLRCGSFEMLLISVLASWFASSLPVLRSVKLAIYLRGPVRFLMTNDALRILRSPVVQLAERPATTYVVITKAVEWLMMRGVSLIKELAAPSNGSVSNVGSIWTLMAVPELKQHIPMGSIIITSLQYLRHTILEGLLILVAFFFHVWTVHFCHFNFGFLYWRLTVDTYLTVGGQWQFVTINNYSWKMK